MYAIVLGIFDSWSNMVQRFGQSYTSNLQSYPGQMDDSADPNLTEQLKKLQAKYDAMGQDLSSYLDGLLYADFLTYWDYIHLDTLLSL